MHKHTVMNLIWNNMILLKISPFKAATVNLTSNILSKLCFILFSTCSTLNFTSLKTGWPYFDLSCFKSVHMQKPSPMSICGLLDWGAGIYSIISWWCCNVLYSSCWERKDAICVAQVIQLVWVPYRPIWSGSLEVFRPQSAGPVGYRTCSTGFFSYSEPGWGRPPLRGRFSPLPLTDSHWANGIPSVFDKVKDWSFFPQPKQRWLQSVGVWGKGRILWTRAKGRAQISVCTCHKWLALEADWDCGETSLHTSLIHFCWLNRVHFYKQFKVTCWLIVVLTVYS